MADARFLCCPEHVLPSLSEKFESVAIAEGACIGEVDYHLGIGESRRQAMSGENQLSRAVTSSWSTL